MMQANNHGEMQANNHEEMQTNNHGKWTYIYILSELIWQVTGIKHETFYQNVDFSVDLLFSMLYQSFLSFQH